MYIIYVRGAWFVRYLSMVFTLHSPRSNGGRDSIFVPFEVSLGPRYSFIPLVIHKQMDKLKWKEFKVMGRMATTHKKFHERARAHIEKKKDQYAKYFNMGKNKKPFKILRRISDSVDVVDMPQEYREGTPSPNLRSKSLQEMEHDMNMGKQ
ncbi:hypothetical protein CR513_18436, partial [Mucuna pruriens]